MRIPSKRQFRLVNGKSTTSREKYFKSWNRVMRPVAKEYEMVVASYDPTVYLSTGDYQRSVNLPLWFVLELHKRVKELRVLRKQTKKLQGIYKRSRTI